MAQSIGILLNGRQALAILFSHTQDQILTFQFIFTNTFLHT